MSNETVNVDANKHGITIGYIRGNLYINDSGIRTDGEMTGISGVKECATGSRRSDHTDISVHPDNEVGEHLPNDRDELEANSQASR